MEITNREKIEFIILLLTNPLVVAAFVVGVNRIIKERDGDE